jgi:hypothetical protein
MKRFLLTSLLLLGSSLQFSCTQLQQDQKQNEQKEEAAAEIPPPLYLGSVHQVFTNDKFALLRIIGPLPPEGTVLITHPADGSTERVGNLIVSSAQHARNNIIAADIRAGGFVGTQQRQKPGKKFPDLIHGALLILEDNLEHPLAHTQALDTVSFHQIYLIYLGNEALLLLLIQKSSGKVNALPACSLGEGSAKSSQIAIGHTVGNGHTVFFGQFFKSGTDHRNPSF